MLEKNYETAANRILKDEGWLCLKLSIVGEAGYPDRLYIHISGVKCWIEWKRNDTQTEPYPLQQVRIRELLDRHQWACWTDNTHDGIWFCRNALVSEGVPSGRYQNATPARRSSFVPGPWPWEDESGPGGAEDPTRAYVDQ